MTFDPRRLCYIRLHLLFGRSGSYRRQTLCGRTHEKNLALEDGLPFGSSLEMVAPCLTPCRVSRTTRKRSNAAFARDFARWLQLGTSQTFVERSETFSKHVRRGP